MLGRELTRLLQEEHIPYVALQGRKDFDWLTATPTQVNALFEEHAFSVCVNCVAERSVEVCEKDWHATKRTNVDVAETIALSCARHHVHLIHLSTDYVFDGRTPPFSPDSLPNPLQNYGISKCMAEFRVMSVENLQCLILRVPVIYSDRFTTLEDSAVTSIGKALMNSMKASTIDDHYTRRPVFARDICKYLVRLIREPEVGIRHFYNPYDATTKYGILKFLSNFLGIMSHDHIRVDEDTTSSSSLRPYDTCLYDPLTDDVCHELATPLEEGLRLCFQRYQHPPFQPMHAHSLFLLIDLDGTLVDTDALHAQCYMEVIQRHYPNVALCQQDIMEAIHTSSVEDVLASRGVDMAIVKGEKNALFQGRSHLVSLMPGAKALIDFIHMNKVNHCVVTNTSAANVAALVEALPSSLGLLDKWITREDYTLPKPNPDSYKEAMRRFHKGEPHIVGFENTLTGYNALRHVTSCIYCVSSSFTAPDAYVVPDLLSVVST